MRVLNDDIEQGKAIFVCNSDVRGLVGGDMPKELCCSTAILKAIW
tara:strand:+ start:305 stop:439 length:135 start_codon:yes stop_codon:yes gene_type:complete